MDTKRILGFIFESSNNFQIIEKIQKSILTKFDLNINSFGQSLNNNVLQLKGFFYKKQHGKKVYPQKTKKCMWIRLL